jgi:pimeloyl-ACP methyl ester carboxylesterase
VTIGTALIEHERLPMRIFSSLLLGSIFLMPAALGGAAAASPAPKTVVLVHGAFADGSSWNKVIPLLEAKGLKVVAVQNPLSSLAADVDATKRAIDMAPGSVILVGHSWGGVVITQAGVDDKVKALVYVAAFALPNGQSVNSVSAGSPQLPWLASVVPDAKGFLRLSDEAVGKYFAQDLGKKEIAVLAATQGPTFGSLFDEKLTAAAYESKPSWYVVAKRDGMIPPPAEKAMAAAIKATVTELDGSHVIMLSKPQEVADVIFAAATAVK